MYVCYVLCLFKIKICIVDDKLLFFFSSSFSSIFIITDSVHAHITHGRMFRSTWGCVSACVSANKLSLNNVI